MPPRPFRETPERQNQRIRKHVAQAQEYWAKGAEHLLEQDLCQAAEKGWGAVAQLTKAVATFERLEPLRSHSSSGVRHSLGRGKP